MSNGLIHLYYGEGKGKTTCAMGLAVRAAGRNIPVILAQFLKSEDSGERQIFRTLPQITMLPLPQQVKFSFLMNEEEKAAASLEFQHQLNQVRALATPGCLVILDEVCVACSTGLLPLDQVLAFLDERPDGVEVVLTGRNPAPALLERADYVTEMKKQKHPYDQGLAARPGIEY